VIHLPLPWVFHEAHLVGVKQRVAFTTQISHKYVMGFDPGALAELLPTETLVMCGYYGAILGAAPHTTLVLCSVSVLF
jgi:hypothetical protein